MCQKAQTCLQLGFGVLIQSRKYGSLLGFFKGSQKHTFIPRLWSTEAIAETQGIRGTNWRAETICMKGLGMPGQSTASMADAAGYPEFRARVVFGCQVGTGFSGLSQARGQSAQSFFDIRLTLRSTRSHTTTTSLYTPLLAASETRECQTIGA